MCGLSNNARALQDAFRYLSQQEQLDIAAKVIVEAAYRPQQSPADLLAAGMGELAQRIVERARREEEERYNG